MRAADRFQGRDRHHRIANPIRDANENFHRASLVSPCRAASLPALQKPSGKSKEIRQQYAGTAVNWTFRRFHTSFSVHKSAWALQLDAARSNSIASLAVY